MTATLTDGLDGVLQHYHERPEAIPHLLEAIWRECGDRDCLVIEGAAANCHVALGEDEEPVLVCNAGGILEQAMRGEAPA